MKALPQHLNKRVLYRTPRGTVPREGVVLEFSPSTECVRLHSAGTAGAWQDNSADLILEVLPDLELAEGKRKAKRSTGAFAKRGK